MTTESMQDFILRDKENFRIAMAVSQAWPETRERLINGFLDRLSERLLKEFPGWKVEKWKRFLIDQWGTFYLYKEIWKDGYQIGLQLTDDGERVIFGIQCDAKVKATRPFSMEILEAVRELYPAANENKWWDAKVPMQSPASDWSTPDVLWRVHMEEAFLDGVAEQLVAVAKISEPILDRLRIHS